MIEKKCPRCNGPMPLSHAGAISRKDNETEICSNCGVDEAMTIYVSAKLDECVNGMPGFKQ